MHRPMSDATKPPRYHLLDEIRGAAILFMIFYHGVFLLGDIFGSAAAWKLLRSLMPVAPYFSSVFVLLCGICSRFSRSNWKRGLRVAGAALLVTLATLALTLFGINEVITFGVLHLMAVAILLFCLLEKPLDKIPSPVQIIFFGALFLASVIPLYNDKPGFGIGPYLLRFPRTDFLPLYMLGFPSRTLTSADYFPLIPWLFLFFAGTALGVYGKAGKFPRFFERSRVPPLQWIGRHSLWIYLAHQPVMFGVAALWYAIVK